MVVATLDNNGETTKEFEVNPKIEDRLIQMLRENILPGLSFEITDKWTGIMAFGETKDPIVEMLESGVFPWSKVRRHGVAIGSLIGEHLASLIRQALLS